MTPCSKEDCERPAVAKGLCRVCYYNERNKARSAAEHAQERPCRTCGQLFSGRDRRAIYCSPRCKELGVRPPRPKRTVTCEVCGRQFQTINKSSIRTCSKVCSWKLQNQIHAAERKAERHRQWQESQPRCLRCGEPIPSERRVGSLYCSQQCKRLAMSARWRERAPGYMRHYLYEVTPDEFARLLSQQDNCCAICNTPFGDNRASGPHVDHNHETGQVRGLLCYWCNNGLGQFRDDPDRLRNAAAYLETA